MSLLVSNSSKADPVLPAGFHLTTAANVDPNVLGKFLSEHYGPDKAAFLVNHSNWWHRGEENQLVIKAGDEIAAYCSTVPVQCLVLGQPHQAIWWIDLIVAPKFRGQGLQTLFDKEVRRTNEVILGFPNDLAASIHRKHAWGVREDCAVLILPLHPTSIKSVKRSSGVRGALLHTGARAASVPAALLRGWLLRYKPVNARHVPEPEAHNLAQIALRYCDARVITTYRDANYITWRYLNSPFRNELRFYVTGPEEAPTHALVARDLTSEGVRVTRILDVFGDMSDVSGLRDLIRCAVRDSVGQKSVQVTVACGLPQLRSALRASGFVVGTKLRFCWSCTEDNLMDLIGAGACHLSLGDSDNDEPD